MKLNFLPLFIGIGATLFLSACHSEKATPAKVQIPTEAIPVKTIALVPMESQSSVFASGQFTTDDAATLSFKTGGVISEITVKEGDAVSAGQVLARLNLTEINALVQQAEIGLEKAERDFNRVKRLFADSVATLEQFQNAKTGLDIARETLATAKFNLQYSVIKAPKSGYVLRKYANVGEVAGPGTPILETNGASAGNWKLRVFVSDYDWARIALSDKVLISTDASPKNKIAATVTRKSESADRASGSFFIEIAIPNAVTGIADGMFAKAEIIPSIQQRGFEVPYTAILDGNADSGFVFTTTDGKTVVKKRILVSEIQSNKAIITAQLNANEQLIVTGSPYLTNGSAITVQNAK